LDDFEGYSRRLGAVEGVVDMLDRIGVLEVEVLRVISAMEVIVMAVDVVVVAADVPGYVELESGSEAEVGVLPRDDVVGYPGRRYIYRCPQQGLSS
jgi:hypothetical protein